MKDLTLCLPRSALQHSASQFIYSQACIRRNFCAICSEVQTPIGTLGLGMSFICSATNILSSNIRCYRRSTYHGDWKESVHRSALALKLLIYEPTGTHLSYSTTPEHFYNNMFLLTLSPSGAVVASPTFSLPEFIGGTRNWYDFLSFIADYFPGLITDSLLCRDYRFVFYIMIIFEITEMMCASVHLGSVILRLFSTPSFDLDSPQRLLVRH